MEEWGDGEGKPCMAVVKNKLFTQGSLILWTIFIIWDFKTRWRFEYNQPQVL